MLAGGSLTVDHERGAMVIRWPNPGGGPMRYGVAAFMGFWLCGWAFGEVMVTRQLLVGRHSPADLFLLFWLGAWTVGGTLAIRQLITLLKPARSAALTLDGDRLTYDPGHDPAAFMSNFNRYSRRTGTGNFLAADQSIPKKPVSFSRSEAGAVRLDWVGERLRLTIDHGANRYEIGTSLTEPEKEWLATRLEQWRVGA